MTRSQLLDLVVRLTSTLADDFSVQDVLDALAKEIVTAFPQGGVAVVLPEQQAGTPVVSGVGEDAVERLGSSVPASDADPGRAPHDTTEVRVVPDGRPDATVLRFPIRREEQGFGTLEMYVQPCFAASGFDPESGQMLADVLASFVAMARRRERDADWAEHLAWAAFHDPLTGLPNRRLLQDRLEQTGERSRRSAAPYGLLFCDLDGFKLVNDRLGHRTGDQLLIEISRRLESAVRPHDTVARVAGDEFVVVCEDLVDPQVVEDVAERVLAIFEAPFPSRPSGTDGLGVSIGIAVSLPDRWEAPHGVLARADWAMYRAKRRGGHRYEHASPTVDDRGPVVRRVSSLPVSCSG